MADITSLTNPKVKQVVRLQRRSSQRRASGLFCVEGARELERAVAGGFPVKALYCLEDWPGRATWSGWVRQSGGRVATVSASVLEKMAYRQRPEGLVAVLAGRAAGLERVPGEGFCLVCSGLEKPGNVGAIVRTADAAGAGAVLVDRPDFDLFNPHCIRASTGAVFTVPVVCADRAVLMETLGRRGLRIVAASPEAGQDYHRADLRRPVALVVGAEHEGLDRAWKQAADQLVSVPMHGTVDSLNVSVTAALLMYEARRQQGTVCSFGQEGPSGLPACRPDGEGL